MPPRFDRLTRAQVLAGLKAHARKHGFVSQRSLELHDRPLLYSLGMYFVGLDAARAAAGVPGPPYRKPRRKTGPKPGTRVTFVEATWTRERVIATLARLHRAGHSTSVQDLANAGHATLVTAAARYAGGLRRARAAAGVPEPVRRSGPSRRNKMTEPQVVAAIRARRRAGKPLGTTRVPQRLYGAGRYRFGSWPAALRAAGIDPSSVRLHRKKYTKQVIVARLREAARRGSDLLAASLRHDLDLKAVNREFGTLRAALDAAGLGPRLALRRHGLTTWTRERVIATLRERARRGEHGLAGLLARYARQFWGSADAARRAAGVPSPSDLRIARRRRPVRGRRRRKPRDTDEP